MWEVSQSCRRTHTHTKALCDIFSMTCHDRRTQFQSPMAEELAGWWYPIVRMDHYQHNLVDFHCCPVLLWSPCFLAKGLRLMFLMGSPPSNTAAINAPNWWCLFACFVKFWANRIFHCVNMCQLLFIHFFSLELGCSQQEKANRDFLDSEPPLHLVLYLSLHRVKLQPYSAALPRFYVIYGCPRSLIDFCRVIATCPGHGNCQEISAHFECARGYALFIVCFALLQLAPGSGMLLHCFHQVFFATLDTLHEPVHDISAFAY